jgi:hypothetical protein
MTERSPALRPLRNLRERNREALDQARLAYEFVPGSYTYGCLSACLAAEAALAVLFDALAEDRDDSAA